jgi:amino-acid N-acetyltransferase
VAVAVKADKLIYLCDAPGLVNAKGALIDAITADEAQKLARGASSRRRHPRSRASCPAPSAPAAAGVGRVHFLDARADGAMLMELFTRDGIGTVLTSAPLARLRDATIDDVGAILGLIEPLEADGTLVKRGRERLEMEITRFSVVEHDGVIVGCAALYPFSTRRRPNSPASPWCRISAAAAMATSCAPTSRRGRKNSS